MVVLAEKAIVQFILIYTTKARSSPWQHVGSIDLNVEWIKGVGGMQASVLTISCLASRFACEGFR